MHTHRCAGLVLNVPEFFADPAFRQWRGNDQPKFTWHRGGDVDEWSDVVVLVDPSLNGEGSDADMPAPLWNRLVEICREHFGPRPTMPSHYMVRRTNLAELPTPPAGAAP